MFFGLIAPDGLAEEVGDFFGVFGERGFDVGDAGGALRPVEPAVGAPGQAAGDGVSVFEAEAGEVDDGIAVGDVVAVFVGIEEQVRRVGDPDAAAADEAGGGDVQAVDEGFDFAEGAVAFFIFEDGDFVVAGKIPSIGRASE